jgi:hypothetical protein
MLPGGGTAGSTSIFQFTALTGLENAAEVADAAAEKKGAEERVIVAVGFAKPTRRERAATADVPARAVSDRASLVESMFGPGTNKN